MMLRDYSTGYKDDVQVFSGLEVEHTPAYGKQTLFLARNDLTFDQIQELADIYRIGKANNIPLDFRTANFKIDSSGRVVLVDLGSGGGVPYYSINSFEEFFVNNPEGFERFKGLVGETEAIKSTVTGDIAVHTGQGFRDTTKGIGSAGDVFKGKIPGVDNDVALKVSREAEHPDDIPIFDRALRQEAVRSEELSDLLPTPKYYGVVDVDDAFCSCWCC